MEETLTTTSVSPAATRAWAQRLAVELRPGDILALYGELGAGKTCFVEGVCRGLDYAGRVRSPSFTLLHVYRGRWPIYHFDLYRWIPVPGGAELEEWEELLDGEGVSLIEWADRLAPELPARTWHLTLEHGGENRRRLALRAPAARLRALRAGRGPEETP